MLKIYSLSILFLLLVGCKQSNNIDLRNGDLLFIEAESENLSGAINRVTQVKKDNAYSHIAIVEICEKDTFVLHASTENGSEKMSFKDFTDKRVNSGMNMDIFRLKKAYQASIPRALSKANTLLGLPYNYSYAPSDSSLYCSDYIERIFRTDSIFTLKPMTFVNPSTGETDSTWVKLYDELGVPIPEGELGCNPNGLAANEKIEFVGRYVEQKKEQDSNS